MHARALSMSARCTAGAVIMLALSWVACGDSERPQVGLVRVVPAADGACGAPADGRTLVVTARGDFPAAEVVRSSYPIEATGLLSMDDFPLATRVLEVEVLGDGGVVRAVGKTGPLEFETLENGQQVAVFMAPVRGLCATGPPLAARVEPLLARAGDHVLVAGGLDADGEPAIAIELYDPATGAFEATAFEHYGDGDHGHGLVGASLTGVRLVSESSPTTVARTQEPPTHVLIAGGGPTAYQVYDASTRTAPAALLLDDGRAFHAAVALDGSRVLLAGGCHMLTVDHQCDPSTMLMNSSIVDVARHEQHAGPALLHPRLGGHAIREASDSVLLIGGVDELGAPVVDIERVHPSGAPGELIPGSAGAAVSLASGSALFAAAHPGGPPDAVLALVPARARQASSLASAPWPLVDAVMTPTEDGAVLLSGATGTGQAVLGLYQPASGATIALDSSRVSDLPGLGHRAIGLADGTVLVVGGRPDGEVDGPAQARAWIVRPELTGPYASDVFISFSEPELARTLIPRDPVLHRRIPAEAPVPAHLSMRAAPGGGALPAEWAVIAGPIFTRGRVDTRVRSVDGGLALMLGFRAADDYVAVILAPDQPVTVYRVRGDVAVRLSDCQGRVVETQDLAPSDPALSVPVALDFEPDSLDLVLADEPVLECRALSEPVPVGRVGLGVVGPLDVTLRVDALSVSR